MSSYNYSTNMKGWKIECFRSIIEDEHECHCEGESLNRIPQMLRSMHRLTISSAGLIMLRTSGLKIYANTLRDITFSNLEKFEAIQSDAFSGIINLRTIYISNSPKLMFLSRDVFRNISNTIKTIRIINSGLVRIPDFIYLQTTGSILHMVDLDGNNINEIDRQSVRIKTEQLILDNNALTEIDDSAFYGSQIAKLSFKGNRDLTIIHETAFYGILNLQELDLSATSIESLPSVGLQELEILRLQNTHSLKTIPSIYNFKSLQIAWLTHSFHCCAFKFPSRHDPTRHAKRIKHLEILQDICNKNPSSNIIDKLSPELREEFHIVEKKSLDFNHIFPSKSIDPVFQRKVRKKRWMQDTKLLRKDRINFENHFEDQSSQHQIENETENNKENDQYAIRGLPLNSIGLTTDTILSLDPFDNPDIGIFHEKIADFYEFPINNDIICGNWTQKKITVSCYPIPDELNPCEDVMGSYWLRWSVWVVVLLAVFGNLSVLIVLLATRTDGSVPKFLMSHLAFADLCMGMYLFLIGSIDAHSMKEYFNYAFDWQYGAGCKIAGFLTVFASHLSVFTLTIITLERWFAITYAIYLEKRIKLRPATYIMTVGWIYSFTMAMFPLFGISNYSSTSICLPMEARDSLDYIYLIAILGVNGAAFFVIAICYAQIYFSLGRETRRARSTSSGEMTIAKKMALLVFTNFSCWAPIAFFGLTALAGYPLINVTKSKILLVFFYPLNSCADPYLYALLTSQYRKDFFLMLSKFGLCKQKALKYKESVSLPTTNYTYQHQLNSSQRKNSSNRSIKSNKTPPPEIELMLQTCQDV